MSTVEFDSRTPITTHSTHRHLVCWRSAFAGLAVALVTYIGALALAIAFGGIGLSDGSTAQNAGIFAGVSVAVATVLATFVGAYYSVRVSRFQVDIMGSVQGLLVGAVFLSFVVFQVLSVVGTVGQATAQTLGATASAIGSGAASASQNPMIRDIVEDNFADLKLKSEPSVVVSGTASRLLRGDNEGAKNYLAGQAGITPAEADQKIAAVKLQMDEAAKKARDAAATALKTTGWSLFLVLALGMIAASLGGVLAAVCNTRQALDVPDDVRRTALVKARA